MNAEELIFSPGSRNFFTGDGSFRIRRHAIFWSLYILYFYVQSISPDCITGLDRSRVMQNAFNSALCFIPACIVCVYITVYVLHPNFLQSRKYPGFFLGLMGLSACMILLNYACSLLFFRLSYHGNIREIPSASIFALAFLNTQNAVLAGCVALGAKLLVRWAFQKRTNLQLIHQKTVVGLEVQRARMRPDYLLRWLDGIRGLIRAGSANSGTMILALSDLLSYWLYDGDEEKVSLEKEIVNMRTFLSLEAFTRGTAQIVDLTVEGDINNVSLPPMSLIPFLQAACGSLEAENAETAGNLRVVVRKAEGDLSLWVNTNGDTRLYHLEDYELA